MVEKVVNMVAFFLGWCCGRDSQHTVSSVQTSSRSTPSLRIGPYLAPAIITEWAQHECYCPIDGSKPTPPSVSRVLFRNLSPLLTSIPFRANHVHAAFSRLGLQNLKPHSHQGAHE